MNKAKIYQKGIQLELQRTHRKQEERNISDKRAIIKQKNSEEDQKFYILKNMNKNK